jgi:hypothetical protein
MEALVARGQLSFLHKGRGLRRSEQLELGSFEGCPPKDAATENLQGHKWGNEAITADVRFS